MIWIASESGLVRYDGVNTKVYRTNSSDSTTIPSNTVVSLHYSKEGNLWLGANDGYLTRYNQISDNFERRYIPEMDSIPDRRIWDLLQQDTILWAAAEFGILKHNMNTGKTKIINLRTLLREPSHPFIQTGFTVHLDHQNSELLWLGTRGGLVSMNILTNEVTFHTQYIPEIPGHGQYAIRNIYQDKAGILWTSGSWTGLSSYDPKSEKWTYFFDGYYPKSHTHNSITGMLQKSASEFWITSYSNGFGIFNKESGSYRFFQHQSENPYTIQKAPLDGLMQDVKGNLWIFGYEGVSFFNPAYQQIHVIDFPERRSESEFPEIKVRAFEMISEYEVLVGARTGDGLYIANLENGNCDVVKEYIGKDFQKIVRQQTSTNFYDLQVYDLLKVSEERIWVAIDTQFAYFDLNQRALVFPEVTNIPFFKQKYISSLQLDRNGNMWGLNHSLRTLFSFNPQSGILLERKKFEDLFPDGLGEEVRYGVRDFHIDSKGQFWMHTYSRVFTYDIEKGISTLIPKASKTEQGTTGLDFYNITGSDDGTILLSCSNNGLQIIHPDAKHQKNTYQFVSLKSGLPSEKVVKVVCHNNDAWLATRKGLVRYHLPSKGIKVFDKSNGLPDHDLLNYWTISLNISNDGKLFVGHSDQFSWIDTKEIYENRNPFNIHFTGLDVQGSEKVLDKNVLFLDRINLGKHETFFTIHFTTDDFTRPDQQQFMYRLVGYDKDWVDAGSNRSATYTKVPGGNYTFEVTGANSSGIWTPIPTQIQIHIDTPFFESKVFFGLIFASLLTIGYMIYQYRMRQVRIREKLKTDFSVQLAEVEMTALRAQMNPHFVFNSLNSINKFILTNEARTASRYLTKFSQLMRLILNNSKSKVISLEDELNTLSLYVEMEQLRFDQKFHFEKHIKTVDSLTRILIPPMLIQPYIENAIWHGLMPLEIPGKLSLSVIQSGHDLICTIEDNGIGRKKAMELKQKNGVRKKSMGMKITSERLQLVEALHHIKTDLEIIDKESTQGKALGTLVTLKIPVRKKEISSTPSKPNII